MSEAMTARAPAEELNRLTKAASEAFTVVIAAMKGMARCSSATARRCLAVGLPASQCGVSKSRTS